MTTAALGSLSNDFKAALWCHILAEDADSFDFQVINGQWNGTYYKGTQTLEILDPRFAASFSDVREVWRGQCPFDEVDYNAALEWIENEIANGRGSPP